MNKDELPFLSLSSVRDLVLNGRVSPTEVAEFFLERIREINPRCHTFLHICEEEALRAAKAVQASLDSGKTEGPLIGVPVAITDSLHLEGYPSTQGSVLLQDKVDEESSEVVTRIQTAGGIIVGKTNLPEFSLRDSSRNRLGKSCCNPWDPSCTDGGSGAASAVAEGLATVALGNDFWGDARLSSALCGVVALKPTRWLSHHPKNSRIPYSQRKFLQRAPIGRSVADVSTLLNVIADQSSQRIESSQRLKIGYSYDLGFLPIAKRVRAAMTQTLDALREAGHELHQVDFGLDEDCLCHFRNIVAADLFVPIVRLSNGSSARVLTKHTRKWLAYGDRVTGVQYSMALSYVRWIRTQINMVLADYDLLVTPTEATPSFPEGKAPSEIAGKKIDPLVGTWAMTLPFNMSGHPAMNVPCGWTEQGLPVGMQIIGRFFEEQRVLQLGEVIEQIQPWAAQYPPPLVR